MNYFRAKLTKSNRPILFRQLTSEMHPCINCYGSLDLNLFSGHARLAGPAKMSNSVWLRFCTTLVLSTLHLSTTQAIGDQQGKKKIAEWQEPTLVDPSYFCLK